MRIRAFENGDAAAVNAIAVSAFAQYRAGFNDWHLLEEALPRTSELAESGTLFVAEDDEGRLIGSVVYMPPFSVPRAAFFLPDWPIIRMLVVDPQARGAGAGRALTQACLDAARADGCREIALHTTAAMEAALSLYRRMGFEKRGDVPDRFGQPYALYVKRLEIF